MYDTISTQLKDSIIIQPAMLSINQHPLIDIIRDILVAYAWPITIIILILIFKTPLRIILNRLGEFFKNLDEITFGKLGMKSKIGTAEVSSSEEQIKSDKMALKILSTFWHYQNLHKIKGQRWTFILSAYNPEYEKFTKSISLLMTSGIVAQDPSTQQFLLTDYGMEYCKKNEGELREPVFTFN
jgi:hypothetical protein